jgi:hypothetical protein
MNVPCSARLTAALAAALLALSAPAGAESIASSASSAGSASVGSLSDSIGGSSDSSRNQQQVAQGEYRIVAVAPADQPGRLRLTLEPLVAAEGATGFTLMLPQETAATQGLDTGDVLSVRRRAYGLAFARADRGEPFYLALADDWQRELDPRAVQL